MNMLEITVCLFTAVFILKSATAQNNGDKPEEPTRVSVLLFVGPVAVLVLAVLLCCKKCKKVYVGDDREQIGRINRYARILHSRESTTRLNDIAQQETCCWISPAEISVDGFQSLQPYGSSKDDKEQLHVLVSVRLACLCSFYKETVTQVQAFLRTTVTPVDVVIVPVARDAAIDEHSLQVIGQTTGTRIYPPAENRQGQTVIQIEGATDEGRGDAQAQVERLIQRPPIRNGGDNQ